MNLETNKFRLFRKGLRKAVLPTAGLLIIFCVFLVTEPSLRNTYDPRTLIRKIIKIPTLLTQTKTPPAKQTSLDDTVDKSALVSSHRIKNVNLRIKHNNWLKIKKIVNLNKEKKVFSNREYFPGYLTEKGITSKIRLRLKGDWTDHIKEEKKWSFRVEMKGTNKFLGMQRFSLQHPARRNMLYEWLAIKHIRSVGLLAPKYGFIRLTVNKEDWGIYAYEEFFSKELLESQQRREGIILKFDETAYWDNYVNAGALFHNWEDESPLTPFNSKSALKNKLFERNFNYVLGQLKKFRKGSLPVSELIDSSLLAKYWALSDLFQAHHGAAAWHNVRFYFNPISSLLEPIHYDGMAGIKLHGDLIGLNNFFYREQSDPIFMEKYIKELIKVTSSKYFDELVSKYKTEVSEMKSIFDESFGGNNYDWENLKKSREAILWHLRDGEIKYVLQGYFSKKTNFSITLKNYGILPLEIISIYSNGNKLKIKSSDSIYFPKNSSYVIQRSLTLGLGSTFNFDSSDKNDFSKENILVNYRTLGKEKIYSKIISATQENINSNSLLTWFDKKSLNQFDFIKKTKKSFTITKGIWTVNKDLIIPAHSKLIIEPGVILKFSQDSMLLSYSPIEFRGTKNAPILLTSIDDFWNGLLVVQAPSSVMNYVSVENVRSSQKARSIITGGVTFYESPVIISNSKFNKSFSEDFVNIIRSKFQIHNCQFYSSFSDALDVDFSSGKITNSIFINNGNDAIDLSGSKVTISDVYIESTGDKGISVGEKSEIDISNLKILKAKFGLVAKDSSRVSLKNAYFISLNIGLASYQKKSEYDFSKIIAENLKFKKISIPYLIESKSKVFVDGKRIQDNASELATKIY